MTEVLQGWIDEVEDGVVYGRVFRAKDDELEFWTPLLSVMESQRVDLMPGRYCSIVNGELLLDSTIVTTHQMDVARAETDRLWRELGLDKPTSPLSSKDGGID